MSIQLNQRVMLVGITLLCLSLVIYKVFGGTTMAATFLSGMLAGIAIAIVGAYLYVAIQTGAPIDDNQ